jgi:hypothetical protein
MKAKVEFTKSYQNEGEVEVGLTLPEESLTIKQYGRIIFMSTLNRFKMDLHNTQLSPTYRKLYNSIYSDIIKLSELLNDTATKA